MFKCTNSTKTQANVSFYVNACGTDSWKILSNEMKSPKDASQLSLLHYLPFEHYMFSASELKTINDQHKNLHFLVLFGLFQSYLLLKYVFYSYSINKLHSCVIFLMFFCPSFHRWCSTTENPPLLRTKRQTARADAGNERVNNTFLIKNDPWNYNITKYVWLLDDLSYI